MIKKYSNIILTNASIIGFGLNNVKANNVRVYVNIGESFYSEDNNGVVNKTNLKDFKGLIDELVKLTNVNVLKKDGNSDTDKLDLAKIDEYFVKSVKVGTVEKLKGATLTDLRGETMSTTDANKLTVELVKKEDKINIKYADTLNGARLIKAKEKEILKKIIQGKTTNGLDIDNVEFKIGGLTQGSTTNNVIGEDIKLFADNEKIEFEITKIKADYKKVVCKFGTGVEEKLVAGVDLEKLCGAFKTTGNGIKKDNIKLSDILTGLNECKVKDDNSKFFKDLNGVSIKKDGSNTANDIITGENQKNFNGANFVVIDGIKEENINPIFLKKTFKVKLDSTDASKEVPSEKITELVDALSEKFKDSVKFSTKDIWNILKAKNGIISTTFNSNIKITKGDTDNSKTVANDDNLVDDKTTEFVIKLPETAFAEGVVETKITITCDDLDNKEYNGKKVKGIVIDAIKSIISGTTSKITKNEFIKNFNTNGTIKHSSDFAEADFGFSKIELGSDIVKSGKMDIKDSFWNKLKDECFETPAKPEGGNGSGSSNGDEQKGDDKKEGKGCSGSGKKNK